MAYKKFYINGGFALVGYFNESVPYTEIDITSVRLTHYEDDNGRLIPYDHPVFRHDLMCDISNGYFHVYALSDEHHIYEYDTGGNAEGDGLIWNLDNLEISYGRNPNEFDFGYSM